MGKQLSLNDISIIYLSFLISLDFITNGMHIVDGESKSPYSCIFEERVNRFCTGGEERRDDDPKWARSLIPPSNTPLKLEHISQTCQAQYTWHHRRSRLYSF